MLLLLFFFIDQNSCADGSQNKIRVTTQEKEEIEATGERVGLGGIAAGRQKWNSEHEASLALYVYFYSLKIRVFRSQE